MKVDLHCHTMASKDSVATREAIIAACQHKGIEVLAITDHNRLTIWQDDRVRFIPGEEILTTAGEIIGLFLEEEIPSGLSPLETVRLIKAQGGLVYLPHPFDRFRRRTALRRAALAEIAPYVDIVEGLNARNIWHGDDRRAQRWAQAHGLSLGAGSDAHAPQEIGTAWVEMADFATAADFLLAISSGKICGRNSPPWVHLYSVWAKALKRIERQPYGNDRRWP